MTISGDLRLRVSVNPGYLADQVLKSEVYNIYNEELLNLAVKLESDSYVGASSKLKDSWDINSRPRVDPFGFTVRSTITNTSKAAINRISGRSPGKFPRIGTLNDPESGLLPWVVAKIEPNPKKAKGIAFAIAMSIAKKGTQRHRTKENFAGLNPDGSLQPDSPILLTEQEIARKLREFSKV